MDDLTPDQVIAIAASLVALLIGLGFLVFFCLYPRHFRAYFGCKIRSAPKITPTGRWKKPTSPASDSVVIQRNPILVLQDRKVAMNEVLPPLRVYRPASNRKEFKVAPIRIPNGNL